MAGGAQLRPCRHAPLPSLTTTGLQIGVLANKGISATDIKKLKDYGLHTVADIQHTTTKTMLNIKGLSEAKVRQQSSAVQTAVAGFATNESAFVLETKIPRPSFLLPASCISPQVMKIKEVARGESGNSFMSGLELKQKRENILKAR